MNLENLVSKHQLNQITARRASLSYDEAIVVWLMKHAGDHIHIIAAKLGINPGRVAEVLTEKLHPGSKSEAFTLISG